MEVAKLERSVNKDAVEVLEDALAMVKNGEISAIALSWLTPEGSMSGQCSHGHNNIMMWAALEHHAREFYNNVICED